MKKICTLLAWWTTLFCYGQPGALDPSWNGKGWRQESFRRMSRKTPDVRDMSVQSDGSVLLHWNGDRPLSKHKSNGEIDESYGYEGYSEPWQGSTPRTIDLPDGRQLATLLLSNNRLGISRYLPNGSLDPGFGEGGKKYLDIKNVVNNLGIIAVEENKILVVAMQEIANTNDRKLFLTRLFLNGLPDESFGTDGISLVDNYGWNTNLTLLKRDGAGRVLIGGTVYTYPNSHVLISCILPSGQLDASFGNQGRMILNYGGTAEIRAISLDLEQRILVASNLTIPDVPDHIALTRLLPNGSIDSTFGTGGHQIIKVQGGVYADAMTVTPKGIYLSGSHRPKEGEGWWMDYRYGGAMLLRTTHKGTPDQGFGTGGFVLEAALQIPLLDRVKVPAISILPNDKILVCKMEDAPLIDETPSKQIRLSRHLADGSPDPDFGTGGSVITTYRTGYTVYNGIALQNDGKVVATGTSVWDEVDPYDRSYDLVVARYHTNGSLDSSFGNNGKIIAAPGGYFTSEFGEGVLVQDDGKIVVGGQRVFDSDEPEDKMLLAMRYLPDGSPDTTFGSGGLAYLTPSATMIHYPEPTTGIVRQGKGYLLGDAFYRVVKFQINGTLDSSYGTSGIAQVSEVPIPGSFRMAQTLTLQPDGKVLIGGSPLQFGKQRAPQFIIRYQENGSLDSSFGLKGIPEVTAGIPQLSAISAMALQPDGKILAAGHQSTNDINTHLVLLRLLEDGTADTSFNGGHVLLPINGRGEPKAIQIQADGKIVVAVNRADYSLFNPEQTELLLYRFLPDGTPDAGFGSNGIFNFSIWNSPTSINAALLTEGRLYTAGSNTFGARSNYGLITAHQMDSGPAGSGLNGFTLIDAIADKDLRSMHNHDTINLALIRGRQFTIRVNAGSTIPASVVMELAGPYNRKQVENTAPFSLFGNAGNKYGGWKPIPGDYTLTATPFSGTKGTGVAGQPITIHFRVIDSFTLSHFTLIDARTDQPLRTLNNGAVIDLSQTPAINISVAPGIGFIGSVRFGLNNQPDYRTENKAPYALAPNQPGRFTAWNIQPGDYTLTATPYGGRNGMGASGQPLDVHFRVIRSGQQPAHIAAANRPLTNEAEQGLVFTVLPNPVHTDARLLVRMPATTTLFIALYDMQGRMVRKLFGGKTEAGVLYQHNLPAAGLPTGTYLLQATDAKGGRYTQRFIKQ